MPKRLVPTTNEYRIGFPVSALSQVHRISESFINTVLEAPGDDRDRFYLVSNVLGESSGPTATLVVQQMREIDAPLYWVGWREILKVVSLDSPLATRLIS